MDSKFRLKKMRSLFFPALNSNKNTISPPKKSLHNPNSFHPSPQPASLHVQVLVHLSHRERMIFFLFSCQVGPRGGGGSGVCEKKKKIRKKNFNSNVVSLKRFFAKIHIYCHDAFFFSPFLLLALLFGEKIRFSVGGEIEHI